MGIDHAKAANNYTSYNNAPSLAPSSSIILPDNSNSFDKKLVCGLLDRRYGQESS